MDKIYDLVIIGGGPAGLYAGRAKLKTLIIDKEVKEIITSTGKIKGRAVIIATGASPRKLGFN